MFNTKKYRKEYYEKNKEKIKKQLRKYNFNHAKEISEKRKEYYQKVRLESNKNSKENRQTLKGRMSEWKSSAKKRKLEFNLTLDYLGSLPLICYYTGTELTLESNKNNTLSLDRIDSNEGYIIGNVCFCLIKVNIMKKNYHLDDFVDICIKISNFRKDKIEIKSNFICKENLVLDKEFIMTSKSGNKKFKIEIDDDGNISSTPYLI